MDFLLLLPVNTRFLVSLRQVDIPSFANAAFAVCVMTYAAGKLHLHPTAVQFLGFGALCMVGLLVHYSLMFMLASVSFWTVRAQGIVWGYYSLFNIARMPDEAFRGVFKAVFTFALPVLLVSNVPVRVLADKLTSPIAWLVLLGLGVIWALISGRVLAFLHPPLHQREHVKEMVAPNSVPVTIIVIAVRTNCYTTEYPTSAVQLRWPLFVVRNFNGAAADEFPDHGVARE